jgi:maleylacetoacetate isomerase
MKLYTYWRSTAAYRVRIALALKNIPYQSVPVHLVKDGGQQRNAAYTEKNPHQLVPLLELDDGRCIAQSLAIIEYLDELVPSPPLLPNEPVLRAQVRSIALAIACDIHPLNNLRVTQYLTSTLHASEDAKKDWYAHWITLGFTAIEKTLSTIPGPFAFGSHVSLADICIVPQVYNAQRFSIPLDRYPRLRAINEACASLQSFQDARPEAQSDAM